MTGKELLLVLAGTAVAAGGAGVAAAVVAQGAPDDGADRSARILARLDELGRSLDGTRAVLDENAAAIDELGDRISAVELRTVGRPGRVDVRPAASDTAAAAPDGSTPADGAFRFSTDGAGQTIRLADGGRLSGRAGQEALGVAMKRLEGELAGLGGAIADSEGTLLQLSGALEGLSESFKLRKLPEDERWEKAREDLGLTQNQVEELQAATAERDEAFAAAMQVERSETTEGGRLTVKNLDPAKAKEAGDAYRRRVDNSLNDEQRKGWREKGYDRAFGKSGLGGTAGAVISISTTHSFSSEDSEQDEK